MTSRHTNLYSRRTGCSSNDSSTDNSFRERKENVQIQPKAVIQGPILPRKHIQAPNGIMVHNHKPSFNVNIIKPIKRDSIVRQTRNPTEVVLRPMCDFKTNPVNRTSCIISRGLEKLTDVERQSANAIKDYGSEIEKYQKELEKKYLPEDCLKNHEITMSLRAKMVDWMVEVLTNFKCNDQTFFQSVSLMDRYLKGKHTQKLISELHSIGVASMFLASKYEDIMPLRMQVVHEKIAHKKLTPESIRSYEQDILGTLDYFLQAPTVYEFLTRYLKIIIAQNEEKDLIEKMSLYLAKMSVHDYYFCNVCPSKVAVSSIYVALKICEQLKKTTFLNREILDQMIKATGYTEECIVECAQRILTNAQNFDTLFPGLSNLKKTHFSRLMEYVPK